MATDIVQITTKTNFYPNQVQAVVRNALQMSSITQRLFDGWQLAGVLVTIPRREVNFLIYKGANPTEYAIMMEFRSLVPIGPEFDFPIVNGLGDPVLLAKIQLLLEKIMR